MKHIKYLIVLLFVLIITCSCKKFVEISPPIDRLNSEVVFSDDQTATSAVLGIYVNMTMLTPVITSGGVTLYTGLASDEIYSTNPSDATKSEFESNSISPENSVLNTDFWFKGYNIIYQANSCIEGLENNPHLNSSIRDQLLGESLFCRAFMYYYFTTLFGDVPLILKTDYLKNGQASRTASAKIYDQIITDLKFAQGLLNSSYVTNGRVRPNKSTATALLARVYLNLKQWDWAEKEATSIINNGEYSLEDDLTKVFLSLSNEAIWQIMPVEEGFNTTEGMIFIPYSWSSGVPSYPLTQYLLSSFEQDDLRKINWIASKLVNGDIYYYPFKYKIIDYGLPVAEYYVVFRLSEQYLIRAECYAHQDKINEAKNDIDIIRERAGLSPISANNSEALLEAISHERRIEFFAEWGHRWFDLKRTQRATEILSPIKADWQDTDTLFPIPSSQIRANPKLDQNQGY